MFNFKETLTWSYLRPKHQTITDKKLDNLSTTHMFVFDHLGRHIVGHQKREEQRRSNCFNNVRFPSSELTLQRIRGLFPDSFRPISVYSFVETDAAELISEMLMLELELALRASNSRGMSSQKELGHTQLVEFLHEYYTQFGLTNSIEQTENLVKKFEGQAKGKFGAVDVDR